VSADIFWSSASMDFLVNAILVDSAVVNEVAGMCDLDLSDDYIRVFFTLRGVSPVIFD